MPDALFTVDGECFLPSEHTRGPWDPDAQHAGPVAALLGRSLEMLPADSPAQIVRVTLEVLRPVPLTPLRIDAGVERAGRRVQLLRAVLHSADGEVARARAVRIRTGEVDVSGATHDGSASLPGPEHSVPHQRMSGTPAFHESGVEMRFARGAFIAPGAAAVWIRLRHPVVDGETPSPLQRVLAAADFGNGVSSVLDWQTHLFINPDLTVYLFRPPDGEWVCLDAQSWVDHRGVGLAVSRLHDEHGPIGESLQSLLVDERAPRPSPAGAARSVQ